MQLLTDIVEIKQLKAPQGSAGTAVNSDSVDCEGCDGVLFLSSIGTANAGNFINLAESANDSDFSDLKNTKVVPDADNEVIWHDLFRPLKRYARVEVDRSGTNTATGQIIAIKYRLRKQPPASANLDATGDTLKGEAHISPVAGTA